MVETRICPDDDNAYIETFRTTHRVGFTDIHGGHEGSVPLNEWKSWERVWPTRPVELNHLEAMALMMLLGKQEEEGGLSEPERWAQKKIEPVLSVLLKEIGVG